MIRAVLERLADLVNADASLVRRGRDVPLLLLTLARPELLSGRPAWGGGLPAYTALPLEPLAGGESEELARRLRVPWLVTVHEGRVTALERGPFLLREWTFAVRASEDAWRRFWEPVPAAGYHDLFALTKGGHARVEGDLRPLMANLRYVKDVLTKPRRSA